METAISDQKLIDMQRQITFELQKQVLNKLDGNFKFYLEALGYSIRLQDRLTTNEIAKELQYVHSDLSHIREY